MCIIYKSVDDFVNDVWFLVSPSFFGDIYKYVNGFTNIKNEFINDMFFKLFNIILYNIPETCVYVPTEHGICTILRFFLTNLKIFLFHDCARKSWNLKKKLIYLSKRRNSFCIFSKLKKKRTKNILYIVKDIF